MESLEIKSKTKYRKYFLGKISTPIELTLIVGGMLLWDKHYFGASLSLIIGIRFTTIAIPIFKNNILYKNEYDGYVKYGFLTYKYIQGASVLIIDSISPPAPYSQSGFCLKLRLNKEKYWSIKRNNLILLMSYDLDSIIDYAEYIANFTGLEIRMMPDLR